VTKVPTQEEIDEAERMAALLEEEEEREKAAAAKTLLGCVCVCVSTHSPLTTPRAGGVAGGFRVTPGKRCLDPSLDKRPETGITPRYQQTAFNRYEFIRNEATDVVNASL